MTTNQDTAPENGSNLFRNEPHVRGLLGVALGAIGATIVVTRPDAGLAWSAGGLSLGLAVMLTLSAIQRHCPFYALLGINAGAARRNGYLALLPQHNPAPVLAFDRQGELQFHNEPAQSRFGHVRYLHDVFGETGRDSKGAIEQGSVFTETREVDGRSFQLYACGVPDADTLLTYAFDITDAVTLEREIIGTQREIIHRMGEIGETRSRETGHHVKRVAAYSRLLAELYGMDRDTAGTLEMASPMHDIGKVAIPDHILNKPGPLTDEEWALMKGHTEVGYNLLRHSDRPILQAAAIVVHQHHEKWDGSGYPRGLSGRDIHPYGRITAVADVFDALGSARPYKPAWSLEAILALLREQRGRHFEPALIDLFLENLDRFLDLRDRYSDPTDPFSAPQKTASGGTRGDVRIG